MSRSGWSCSAALHAVAVFAVGTPLLARAADVPTAYVSFLSDPPGAHVRLNGTTLDGRTPLLHYPVAPGFIQVEMTREGHTPARDQRTLEANSAVRIDLRLEPLAPSTPQPTPTRTLPLLSTATPSPTPSRAIPAPHATATRTASFTPSATLPPSPTPTTPSAARVSFASDPPGAAVIVNGLRLGTAPIPALAIDAGTARISFALRGFETVDIERTWQPAEEDHVEVVLFPLRGTVIFRSDPAWTSIQIDGEVVDLHPGEPKALLEGHYQVRAVREEETALATFTIEAGTEVHVDLIWRHVRPDVNRYALIAGGRATLGDARFGEDNPPREEAVAGFWMERTEVTVEQYAACVSAGRCEPTGTEPGCTAGQEGLRRHPINCVRVADAEAYAAWLSEQRGYPHRLPSCDEWEHAARRGGRYPWGAQAPEERCNTCDTQCAFRHFRNDTVDDGWRETAPVGSLRDCRSAAGVVDLIGNVAEWCRAVDGYQVRGGSWGQVGIFLDPAFATRRPADDRDPTVGFRLVVPE